MVLSGRTDWGGNIVSGIGEIASGAAGPVHAGRDALVPMFIAPIEADDARASYYKLIDGSELAAAGQSDPT